MVASLETVLPCAAADTCERPRGAENGKTSKSKQRKLRDRRVAVRHAIRQSSQLQQVLRDDGILGAASPFHEGNVIETSLDSIRSSLEVLVPALHQVLQCLVQQCAATGWPSSYEHQTSEVDSVLEFLNPKAKAFVPAASSAFSEETGCEHCTDGAESFEVVHGVVTPCAEDSDAIPVRHAEIELLLKIKPAQLRMKRYCFKKILSSEPQATSSTDPPAVPTAFVKPLRRHVPVKTARKKRSLSSSARVALAELAMSHLPEVRGEHLRDTLVAHMCNRGALVPGDTMVLINDYLEHPGLNGRICVIRATDGQQWTVDILNVDAIQKNILIKADYSLNNAADETRTLPACNLVRFNYDDFRWCFR